MSTINLRAMGFCGVDDSVSPELLQLVSNRYNWIEWGVLFRSDLAGEPRYPTSPWVERLSTLCMGSENGSPSMKLAGHLCADRCQAVLEGDFAFIEQLYGLGFRRVQVNATAANSVSVEHGRIDEYVANIKKCMNAVSHMEFIIQCNDETKPIYEKLIASPEPNMSLLYDASCGKGVRVSSFPSPMLYPTIPCGYAGGIGPDCITDILAAVKDVTAQCNEVKTVWIDMESSLRTIVLEKGDVRRDVFSIDKCMSCVAAGCAFGLPVSDK